MTKNRKEEILKLLNEAIEQKRKSLDLKVEASLEIAQAGMGSYSINSERHITETVAETAKKALFDLIALRGEIESASDVASAKVEVPCWIEITFKKPSEKIDQFFYLSTHFLQKEVKVVSSNSPLGQALLGKYPGNPVIYEINGVKNEAVVTKIM